MWGLRVWRVAVEDVRHGFAFLGRQRGDENEATDAWVRAGRDHGAGVGVRGEDDGALGAVE